MILAVLSALLWPPGPIPPEPDMMVGTGRVEQRPFRKSNPIDEDPDRSKSPLVCSGVLWYGRELARNQILEKEFGPGLEATIQARLAEWIPTAGHLEAHNRTINRRIAALFESERTGSGKDSDRDRTLWATQLADDMSYQDWVQFRTSDKGASLRRHPWSPLREPVSVEHLEKQRDAFRDLAIEAVFQSWVLSHWALPRGHAAQWTDAVQDAFWADALEAQPMTFRAELGCRSVRPSDLRRRLEVNPLLTMQQIFGPAQPKSSASSPAFGPSPP
ncbi:MAG: hypothetical protein JNK60_21480 [Acidobacteria bacterium]|nr:hypothetical protein [Acidobacteriota bacterium]